MDFAVLEPTDDRWGAMFEALGLESQDVFYAPDFARLCQETLYPEDEVRCAVQTTGNGVLMYPFVRRSVATLLDSPIAENLYDTTSLYGRGGLVGRATDQERQAFYVHLGEYCAANDVFCSFDRFHPVMGNHIMAPEGGRVMEVGGFVVVDLRPSMDDVVASFKPSVRKDIRKAERNAIECFAEDKNDHLGSFLEIYYQTMDRNAAEEFHYFTEQYFSGMARFIPGKFLFFYAVFEGEVVSCELVVYHGKYAHSFLGGTKRQALPLAANPMLKKTILEKMKSLGCEYFLLGGGYAPNDGIFSFKKAYAPNGVYPSFIGGTVWQTEVYERLKRDLEASGRDISPTRFQYYDV